MIHPRTATNMLNPLSCFSLVDVKSLDDATERVFKRQKGHFSSMHRMCCRERMRLRREKVCYS